PPERRRPGRPARPAAYRGSLEAVEAGARGARAPAGDPAGQPRRPPPEAVRGEGRPVIMRAADDHPRYSISVAAELAGMHPQTLRTYEAKGLVRPRRTPGGTRRYSDRDVER